MTIHHIIEEIGKLLNDSGQIPVQAYQDRFWTVKREALDALNRRSLGGNPIYAEVERNAAIPRVTRLPEEDTPDVRKLVCNHGDPALRFLRSRLGLAVRLKRTVKNPVENLHGNSAASAVVLVRVIRKELRVLLNCSHADYDSARKHHPKMRVFSIADMNSNKSISFGKQETTLKEALANLPKHRRHLLGLSRAFVAAMLDITVGGMCPWPLWNKSNKWEFPFVPYSCILGSVLEPLRGIPQGTHKPPFGLLVL